MDINFSLIWDALPLLLAGAGITIEIKRRLWPFDRYDSRYSTSCQYKTGALFC